MRLHPETPARQALVEFLRPVRRPQGRPIKTWFECVRNDLKDMNIDIKNKKAEEVIRILEYHTHIRERWRFEVMCAVPRSSHCQ